MQQKPAMHNAYEVAGHLFHILLESPLAAWKAIEWHYSPFACDDDREPLFVINLRKGGAPADLGTLVYEDTPEEGMLALNVYDKPEGTLFEIRQPNAKHANGWVTVSHDYKSYEVIIDENAAGGKLWPSQSTLTSAMMLSYMLATTPHSTLMAHAASVLFDGKAYLFIAKSGTGKSTHARLWIDNIRAVELLNDDHPIVRFADGHAIAYGSPWSGKTDCYRNIQAPIGAIVRIKRAKANAIERLSPLLAYASISTSFSGLPWAQAQADARHATLEQIVMSTPCYTLECLPDADAALLCNTAVAKS